MVLAARASSRSVGLSTSATRRAARPLRREESAEQPSDVFDVPRIASTAADSLKGTGASAGVVRGPAKVTLSQDDFGRIQPGDIIVVSVLEPVVVPIFTIAGGLITNTGGVLSYAAVVAREVRPPGGRRDGRRDDEDHRRLVEIDGTAGTVKLLSPAARSA